MASVRLGTFRRARAPAAAQISPQQHPMMLIVSALPWFSQAGLELEEKRNAITITCPLPGMQGVAGFRDTNLVGRLRIVQLIIGLSAATVQGEGRRLSLSLIHGPIVAQLGLLGAWKSILAKNDYDGNVLMRGGVLEECGKWCPWGIFNQQNPMLEVPSRCDYGMACSTSPPWQVLWQMGELFSWFLSIAWTQGLRENGSFDKRSTALFPDQLTIYTIHFYFFVNAGTGVSVLPMLWTLRGQQATWRFLSQRSRLQL